MAKNKGYVPQRWEHDKRISKARYFSIYKTMMDSPAWKELKPRAQILYLNMKTQVKPNDQRGEFTFSKALYHTLKLYTNDNEFCKDKDTLISKGFIDCIDGGSTTKTKAIYRMSDRWTKYGTDKYECPPGVMSDSMKKKLNKSAAAKQ